MNKIIIAIYKKIKNNFLHFRVRIFKFYSLIKFPNLWVFILFGIMPAFEHLKVLRNIKNINSLIDCGSNKGQFAILIFSVFRIKSYLSFDPIVVPVEANKFLRSKKVDTMHKKVALSLDDNQAKFYITEREDSSSLKKTISHSSKFCPDVIHKKTISVQVKKLDDFEQLIKKLPRPKALKVDVQGSEYELLIGARSVLEEIDYLFVEISYKSLYLDTQPNHKIFTLLEKLKFKKISSYNFFLRRGKLLSKDYLFIKDPKN